MKLLILVQAAALGLCLAGPLPAAEYVIKMTAVKGRITHSHSQKSESGVQDNFVGKSEAVGEQPRNIVFTSLLKKEKGGLFHLDYMFELSGEDKSRPPLQARSGVSLAPGKKILAAAAEGWRYFLELDGKGQPPADTGNYQLSADFICSSATFQATLAAVKDQEASITMFSGKGGAGRKFTLTLLPGAQDAKGALEVQYNAAIKGEKAVFGEAQGKVTLSDLALIKTIPAGENCKLSAKALRF